MTDCPTLNVLLVDDAYAQYTIVQAYLLRSSLYDYRVTWAANPAQARDLMAQQRYDVCLVDYVLGPYNGLDFIREQIRAGHDTPMIVLTGHESPEIDIQAMQSGAVDYLDKTSLTPPTLERTIRYTVERTKTLRALRQSEARLHEIARAEREQRVLAESLLDVAAALNSTLQFDAVLTRILSNLSRVLPHDSANILMTDGNVTTTVAQFGYEAIGLNEKVAAVQFPLSETPVLMEIYQTRRPLSINDIHSDPRWIMLDEWQALRSYLGAPIIINDEVTGFINLDSLQKNFFTEKHADFLQSFATHAAVAMRNARAYEHAQALAALEERQRLARDLHDAVSQTLFSASVIAESLPRQLDQNPEKVRAGLNKLTRLNRGALAEMRSLLMELRPNALEHTDFVVLIRNLINGLISRSDADVQFDMDGDYDPPQTIKPNLYRIVQEALNNIRKHAQASHVQMTLAAQADKLSITIADNGCGFDPMTVTSSHFGLRIMFERAEEINAKLDIHSTPGEGTHLHLSWIKATEEQ